ncbi:Hypoxanthine phosphoribosyltransferase [wastewater metagenome]|uniref:Hypoxanthine phosphoribosyltransferase n=2 Tax=unclassified sequences TaxID=12908 RepID=A0A5B8RDQ7_9ZZZZ|nr:MULTISPECIES: hypoxanthine-guanine phosphoribosyltransferase [Arhodomonas]MCS4503291.1 hypoxanthine-guanine phosphoribosyltransferase [Arhodomonas aquaeolei]QEA05582.1 hypoxanthine phosphoribosyltransferase [uncultured organism]
MSDYNPVTPQQLDEILSTAEILHTEAAVESALDDMARRIETRLGGTMPVVLGVMTGAIVPLGRLLPRLQFPLEVDYIHATRYHGSTVGRDVIWLARPQTPLKGRTVLIVDDILDEGHTLAGIIDECRDEGAKAVYTAMLFDKQHDRRYHGLQADFTGLSVTDRYVFGSGMDYKGYFRNLGGVYAVHPDHEGE